MCVCVLVCVCVCACVLLHVCMLHVRAHMRVHVQALQLTNGWLPELPATAPLFRVLLNIKSRCELINFVVRVTCLQGKVDSSHKHTHHLQTSRETPVSMLSGPLALVCVLLAWGVQAKLVSTFQTKVWLSFPHCTPGYIIKGGSMNDFA
jgi:hypothetical protein